MQETGWRYMQNDMGNGHQWLRSCTCLPDGEAGIIQHTGLRGLPHYVNYYALCVRRMILVSMCSRTQQNLDHLDGRPADLGTFNNSWRVELPWIVLAKSESLFTGYLQSSGT